MSTLIRKAVETDIPDLARIHLASKLAAEKGIIDEAYLNAKTQSEYEENWQSWLMAEDSEQALIFADEKPVGLISYGALRTAPAGMSKIRPLYSSEIYAIYIHPDEFGKGYGKAIFQYAVQDLMDKKHQSLCLWALDKNKRACRFYEALGGQRVGKKMTEFGPTKAKEACYAWRNIKEILEK